MSSGITAFYPTKADFSPPGSSRLYTLALRIWRFFLSPRVELNGIKWKTFLFVAKRRLPFQAGLARAVYSATTPQMNSALRSEDQYSTRTGNAWEWHTTHSQADGLKACRRRKQERTATLFYRKHRPKWLPTASNEWPATSMNSLLIQQNSTNVDPRLYSPL